MAQDERDLPNPRQAKDKKKPSGGRPKFSLWIFYVLIFLGLLLVQALFWPGSRQNEIEYSEFLEYVEKGYIQELTVRDNVAVEGLYTEEAAASAEQIGIELSEVPRSFIQPASDDAERAFRTVKPQDHDLTEFLQDYNERAATDANLSQVQFAAGYDSGWITGILSWVIPIGLIVLIWVFFLRRMGGPGQQVLNIGKSKAALFDSMADQKLTFEDVAGLQEAKEEVVEVVDFLKNPKKFTRLGGKLPKGVLLVGPAGYG